MRNATRPHLGERTTVAGVRAKWMNSW